ncbi:MAG: AMIN domain-containing protein [Desulfobacterales bacterium]|uniref:AMIN domain-containing protein n=1 Tax=Candidatus Desulfatibia vada TaxID=2841696 RepID=A0A8J6TTN0_9BACT|nr:AMIN domain-containing protein [Candidatus Desulfatibia vada]MBL6972383.1 AMIN domain-containing protein [Desulfobacterales bacterium]
MKKAAAILILCIALLCQTGSVSAGDIDAVRAQVFAWSEAWQNRDIDTYMSFYSPSFQSKGLDFERWREKRAEVFQQVSSIQVEISDLWVFIEGKQAIVSFIQRYSHPMFADIGEKTLVMVDGGFTWQIVSEEWKPIVMAGRPDHSTKEAGKVAELNTKSQTEADNIVELNTKTQQATQEQQGLEAEKSSTGKTVVKSIRFEIEKEMEKVFVDLNKYALPRVRTLEGDNPRIVLDFMNAASWRGPFRIPANGKLVKQIRAYLHHKVGKLRIVLDLNPAEDYIVDQTFYKAENIYCITVQ